MQRTGIHVRVDWQAIRFNSMGPVSSPSSICMMVTPVVLVAGHDGALDRRGPAPARQQRGMDVEAAMARRVQDGFGQDEAVGRDHGDIGIQRREGGGFLRVLAASTGVRTGDALLFRQGMCTGDF